MILFNEIGNRNVEIKRMRETRITALSRLNKLPSKTDREAISRGPAQS